jgi:hypothetical protein
MSLLFGGVKTTVAGLQTVSFADDPTLAPQITKSNARTRRVRAIILHTTSGTCASGKVKPGRMRGTDSKAGQLARYQAKTKKSVSWDYTIGRDAIVLAQNDPVSRYSWHATSWNPLSVGIEIVQNADGSLYGDQLQALVLLVDELTRRLRIQRQLAWADDAPLLTVLKRADELRARHGVDMVGVFAHANNTKSRDEGDPGPAPFRALCEAGYELFDFRVFRDIETWKQRQQPLGISADGIALTDTCAALERQGYKHGLWVSRPND